MRSAIWLQCSVACLALMCFATSSFAEPPPKKGPSVDRRTAQNSGSSRVIVSLDAAASLPAAASAIARAGGVVRRPLAIINGFVADMPNPALNGLAKSPFVSHIALDRPIVGTVERTGATIGSTAVRQELGYDGSGIGVAVIDSGITAWHDDLTGGGSIQRVDRFVDFVNGRMTKYDDYGHGTHVAGIIAGNGADSSGGRAGIAPNARLIVLKVLDAAG